MSDNNLPDQSDQELIEFITELNEKLEEEAMVNANRAFNLGCMIAIIPAGLVVLIAFFVSKGSWIPVTLTAVLMLIALLLLANLLAYTARNRTFDRVYKEDIAPKIEHKLSEIEISKENFTVIADELLPEESNLRKYLSIETELINEFDDEIQNGS